MSQKYLLCEKKKKNAFLICFGEYCVDDPPHNPTWLQTAGFITAAALGIKHTADNTNKYKSYFYLQ